MLWVLMTTLIGIGLQSYTEKRGDLEPRVMMVYTLATTFLLIMVSPMMKNPFAYIWQGESPFIEVKYFNQQLLQSLAFIPNFLFGNEGGNPTHLKIDREFMGNLAATPVSYTHLDVYKRQVWDSSTDYHGLNTDFQGWF